MLALECQRGDEEVVSAPIRSFLYGSKEYRDTDGAELPVVVARLERVRLSLFDFFHLEGISRHSFDYFILLLLACYCSVSTKLHNHVHSQMNRKLDTVDSINSAMNII